MGNLPKKKMGLEEQSEEIEVLSSIFPDELEVISTSPNSIRINLQPNPTGQEENHVAVSLLCTFPEEYPECVPSLDVEIKKGLGRKQVEELKIAIDNLALENVGMQSIFTIVEYIKEWLQDNNMPGQDGSMYAEMLRRMQQKDMETKKIVEKAAVMKAAEQEHAKKVEETPEELARIRKRQAGKPVTVESFMEWKMKFDEEMRQLSLSTQAVTGGNSGSSGKGINEGAIAKESGGEEKQLTGKQWFLLNSNAGVEQEDELIAAGELELDNWAAQLLQNNGGNNNNEDEDDEDDEDYEDSGEEDEVDEESQDIN